LRFRRFIHRERREVGFASSKLRKKRMAAADLTSTARNAERGPFHDIVVIGASAGGLEGLRGLVAELPRDFPAAIFIVWHISPDSPGVLPEILSRSGELPAFNASHKEPILPGRIYVAPPDFHLVVENGYVCTTRGPRENRFRPAVDPLFRSAAAVYGPRVVGVILSGGLDDGTAGLWAVKQRGGVAVVQHPEDALVPSMPQSALNSVPVDYCVPLSEMASLLVKLANTPVSSSVREEGTATMSDALEVEVSIARDDNAIESGALELGELSPFACPECHGMLRELKEGDRLRYRCYTGHAYSAQSLLSEATQAIEDYLWIAIRGIEESVLLLRHLAHHMLDQGHTDEAAAFLKKAEEAHRRSSLVRQAALQHEKLPNSPEPPDI
jgi:two-component system chemotaxis response regulator CheB